MDPREYRDARWHSLLREAADLGVPEEDASALVERVLAREERRIRRADDPDPLVREALAEAVSGPRPPSRRGRTVAVAVVVGALLVGGGTAYRELTRPDPPSLDQLDADQLPSLFGYAGPPAAELLKERGLEVRVQPFRSCEVLDRVIGSDPPTGTTYRRGDEVTVYTALPADVTCLTDYGDREIAWALLDFANGRGPAPAFGRDVVVYGAAGQRTVLDGDDARRPEAWASTGVLDGIREASAAVRLTSSTPPTYAVPAIRVVPATGGPGTCGVPGPSVAGGVDVFAVLIRPPDRQGCGVRLDVFRDDRAIVAVAYYPAES